MTDTESTPFLLRFAEHTGSPPVSELGRKFYYDEETQMLRSKKDSSNPFAIDLEGEQGPKTKKHDVEKGDDNKDRGMWA